jgi:(1->4)-alpha-D-glucan 1-alpha-D-glucosylmutase
MPACPLSTYRIQMAAQHGFDGLAEAAPYVAKLGISDAYLSPILQAIPGSQHGYDVIDHTKIDADLGGEHAFEAAVKVLNEHDIGAVVDVVPNHMAMPAPETLNPLLWSILRDGPDSPYARWIDATLQWDEGSLGSKGSNQGTLRTNGQAQQLILPILGARIDEVLDAGELTLDPTGGPHAEPVLRYHGHVLPVRQGTEELPLEELLARQHYRLAFWRAAHEELNYRRFFDIDTLVAIRVELPEVFEATHELTSRLVARGVVNGLRIDHPDGLADPRGYLRRLADVTGDVWVVAEKILAHDEALPSDWACAGTTGYEAAVRIGGLFVDPAAGAALKDMFAAFTGFDVSWSEVVEQAKRDVLDHVLTAELDRLADVAYRVCQDNVRLRDHSRRGLTDGLVELLIAMDVYRAYVVPGEDPPPESVNTLERAAASAQQRRPDLITEIDLLVEMALGRLGRGLLHDEFCVRFQQTSGPVAAKGVEDTACYRWFPLTSLCEVGGEPDRFGTSAEEFHQWAAERHRHWPHTMNALSTHDTKRSEDVRARLAVLSELPSEWWRAVSGWRDAVGSFGDPVTEWLLWQTLVGAWPIDANRLMSYLVKATREAKVRTSWSNPDTEFERRLDSYVGRVFADEVLLTAVARFVDRLHQPFVVNCLGQRAIQLLTPGAPDIYAGCETVNLRLVDPDNRVLIDTNELDRLLDAALISVPDPWTDLPGAKLRLTSLGLRLRRRYPEVVGAEGGVTSVDAAGSAAGHVVGLARGDRLAVVATRLSVALTAVGGWRETSISLPTGTWRELLTESIYHVDDGHLSAQLLLTGWPVALLERVGG